MLSALEQLETQDKWAQKVIAAFAEPSRQQARNFM